MHGLALQMGRTVGELEQTLSAREFMRWLVWFEMRAEGNKPAADQALGQWFQIEN